MNTYYNNLMNENFINRTEIRDLIESYYNRFNVDGSDMFNIFYIYGSGGMGKSYLIKYFKRKFQETLPKNKLIHITFEIQNNSQVVYSLVKIRKAFERPCATFDYALLYYWSLEHIEKIDDEFLNILKHDLILNFVDMGLEVSSQTADVFSISISGFQTLINHGLRFIQNRRIKTTISEIEQMDGGEVLEKLPHFLANDIGDYMKKKNENFIFLFDSYRQSIPYSESEEWLLAFISELQKGLYIITGREKLQWKPDSFHIKEFHLNTYPEQDTRQYLESFIPVSRRDIQDAIIKTSQCFPIYVSLACDLYLKEANISKDDLIKKSKFKDRTTLVKHFINHLEQKFQDVILYLAVIKVFNQAVFDELVDQLHLPCTKLDFYEIVNVSLFKYTEHTNDLYKLHDVFCSNAVSVLNPAVVDRIYGTYLTFLSKREIYTNLINNTLDSIIALFNNAVELATEYPNEIDFDSIKAEKIIDLFLILYDTRVLLILPKPSMKYDDTINSCLYFMDAILYEKVNTIATVEKLKMIKEPRIFGKHYKSYNIILKYTEALKGQYKPLKHYLENLKDHFGENEKAEWYYLKTFIYLSDYYMMEGEFIKAYNCLESLRESVSLEIYHTDNYFLLERSIGHIHRFNYDFEAAAAKYKKLLNMYEENSLLTVYLLVNLCETKCFTEPQYVIDHFDEALKYVNRFHNLKNKAKLYYARGIANTLLKRYSQALVDIELSIQINRQDGYQAGELFAYQAKAFYEYGERGYITPDTMNEVEHLVKSTGVYHFLQYPLHLINGTKYSLNDIQWLQKKKTEKNCQAFLRKLRI